MTTGVAICSYERPEFAEKCVKAVRKHLTDVVDHIVFVNDGSSAKHNGSYRRVQKAVQSMNGTYIGMDHNQGVAAAKNIGLQFLLDRGCDWLFTCEDDIIVQSPKAVTEYIRVAKTGVVGLSFAHHGEANYSGPADVDAAAVSRQINRFLHGPVGTACTAHTLRHAFLTAVYQSCHDLRLTQELMGHSSPQTTAGYAASDISQASGIVSGLTI